MGLLYQRQEKGRRFNLYGVRVLLLRKPVCRCIRVDMLSLRAYVIYVMLHGLMMHINKHSLDLSMDGVSEGENSLSDHSSMPYDSDDLIESCSSTPSLDRSSSKTIMPTSGQSQSSKLRRTSRAIGQNGASSYCTDLPESASPNVLEESVKRKDSVFGSLPSVPRQFGTMVTTVTLRRSSTTSEAVAHSATCFASLKAMRCSCKSKGATQHLDLQWSTLPATDTVRTGPSAQKGTKRASSGRNSSSSRGGSS